MAEYPEPPEDSIEEIEMSVINGNRDQAYDQIMNYGYHNFFIDYRSYLVEMDSSKKEFIKRYTDMVDLFVARIQL